MQVQCFAVQEGLQELSFAWIDSVPNFESIEKSSRVSHREAFNSQTESNKNKVGPLEILIR